MSENPPVLKRLAITIGFMLFIFVGMSIFLNYLINKSKIIYIHNPHEEKMTAKIDDKSYILDEYFSLELEIEKGEHHFVSSLGDSILIDTTMYITHSFLKSGGIINLSKQPMYLLIEKYGENSSLFSNSINEPNFKVVMVDSTTIIGDITEVSANKIIIPKTWDYDLDEYFPETIEVKQGSSYFGLTKIKIYDKPGILDYWKDVIRELDYEDSNLDY